MKKLLVLAMAFAVAALGAVVGATPSVAASAAHAAPAAVHHTAIPIKKVSGGTAPGVPTIAENWSGYAVAGQKYTYVHSRFVQPAITCPAPKHSYTTNWVGLDGFTSGTVEQDGTQATCSHKDPNTPAYEAWIEMYPAASVNEFAVKAGDTIDASVNYTGGKFVLTVKDLTNGRSATTSAACSQCVRSSAEWIIERPALCSGACTSGFITPLSDFGTTTMSQNSFRTASSGATQQLGTANNYPIYMIQPLPKGFISMVDTSPVTKSNSFTITWFRAGKEVPISF